VRATTGIDFSQYKRATILRRLQRRMLATGQQEELRDYIRFVQSNPEEMLRLANSFLIKVTEFFRDPDCTSSCVSGSSRT
jgi:two-component system CheB/CheR fusion protein